MTNQEMLEMADAIIASDRKVASLRKILASAPANSSRKAKVEQAEHDFGALCDMMRDAVHREDGCKLSVTDGQILAANGNGMDAYDDSKSIHDNPYDQPELRTAWHDGYKSAERNREDA